MAAQHELFAAPSGLPKGLVYRPELLTVDEESALVATIAELPLREAKYKAFTAKRRILSFGAGYDFDSNHLVDAPPLPAFLVPLRDRVATWAGVPSSTLSNGLVAEYRPGTALGWHRDVPNFEFVVGVSLGTPTRMRFRPYPLRKNRREGTFALLLEPRSAYILRDEARWRWQHSIPPTKGLRYSITFRTLRRRPRRGHAAGGSAGTDSRTITSGFTLSAPSIALYGAMPKSGWWMVTSAS
jgi:alkylated DNA repair dioxygenase AlkB